MKRYLVTLTGRANLGCKGNKLREHDLCYSYVFGKNKDEAISKFWEQISNCSGLKGFERRDFKITAERWEKDSFLDVNGDVVTDIEWAIPFDLLASLEMIHDEHYQNYHLAIPLDFKIEETTNQANVDHPQPEAKYNVNRFNKRTGKEESMGIWLGDGMSNFKAGSGFLAGKFYCEEDEWIYYAEEQPQESSEPVAQENIQPELEDATESISEPQEASPRLFKTSKRLEIPKAEIDKWNRMLESAKGSSTYYTFTLWHEGNDEHGRWFALGHGDIRAHMISHPSDCYFIKKIKENTWLYFEDCAGIQERWLLSDVARAFFLPEPSDDERDDSRGSEKASESSSDSSNEIIKGNTEKPTEKKSEGKDGITTSLIAVGEFLVIEERKDGESWAYYHGNDFLWSSAERFSQDDLLRMYGNGYFMEELKKQRIRKYDAIEKCKENDFPDDVLVRMRNELNAIDDEIARLFSKEVKDEHI